MGLIDILKQYAGTPQAQSDTPAHFDEVARSAPPESLGTAISSMFRSNSTPPFGQIVGTLFNQSNPEQRAGVLNQIIQSMGPAALGAGGGVLGRILGSSGAAGPTPTVTPQHTSQFSPTDVTALATQAEKANPSVVDTVGAFYSQHPALVKTLGAAALAVALSHMRTRSA
jgi:hypothetical protein